MLLLKASGRAELLAGQLTGVAGEEATVPGCLRHAVLGRRGSLVEQLLVGEVARAMGK